MTRGWGIAAAVGLLTAWAAGFSMLLHLAMRAATQTGTLLSGDSMTWARVIVVLLPLLVLAGCPDDESSPRSNEPSTSAVGAQGGGGQGSAGGGGGGAPSQATCPQEGTVGGACNPEGLWCSFGDTAAAECRAQLRCQGGYFVESPITDPCPDLPPCGGITEPSGSCDSSTAHECSSADGAICACSACVSSRGGCGLDPMAWWECGPPPKQGCPGGLPNAGQPCQGPDFRCYYGANHTMPLTGVCARCNGGAWAWDRDFVDHVLTGEDPCP
jgi:hypothetical protein